MAHLFLSQAYLIDSSIIDNNVDYKKITPIIELVQDMYILPLLGTNLYNTLVTQSTSPTSFTGLHQTLLEQHVIKTARMFLMAKLPLSLQYRYMNKGVVKRTSDGTEIVNGDELKNLVSEWMGFGQTYADRMRRYIIQNISSFPAYSINNGIDQISPQSAYEIDIFLPEREIKFTNDSGPLNG
jgi:hypothetical protein